MNFIIVGLTRMGDILQSTPLLMGLKESYPQCRITYLANEPYAEICKGIPLIDDLITFNMEMYQVRLLSETMSLIEEYRFLEGFINRINQREYDVLINLTPSRICAVLTSVINAKEVRGLTVDNEGHRVIKDRWMRYLSTSVFNRGINPFNLVDMYLRMGMVSCKNKSLYLVLPEEVEQRTDDLLEEEGVAKDEILIAFQPGASKEHKMWGASRFAELSKKLIDGLGVKVIVLGSKGEKKLGEEIKGIGGDGVIDMTGRTSIMELAGVLKRCRILITNDSGTMHIALAVGTRVVELSLGAAYFRETGPYGQGNIVIESNIPCHPCSFQAECKEMVCREYINVECVYKVIEMLLNKGDLDKIKDSAVFTTVQIYKASFDKHGFLEYIPLIRRQLGEKDLCLYLYRAMWKEYLDEIQSDAIGIRDESDSILSSFNNLSSILEKDADAIQRMQEIVDKGISLVRKAMALDTNKKECLQEISGITDELSDIDGEIQRMGYLHPNLKPITVLFSYNKENIEGDDIKSLMNGMYDVYIDVKTQLSILKRLLSEKCLQSIN